MLYIPEQIFNIIIEYGLPWIVLFRILNKQIKSKADTIIANICYNSLGRNFILIHYGNKILINDKISSSISLSYLFMNIANILITTPIHKITIAQCMFIYDIAYTNWASKQRMSFSNSLDMLFKRSFQLCNKQENCKHYIIKFYRRTLFCVNVTNPSVKELLELNANVLINV
jgi:hypothetical protein